MILERVGLVVVYLLLVWMLVALGYGAESLVIAAVVVAVGFFVLPNWPFNGR